MSPLPRKGAVSKPRLIYGRQRSLLDTHMDEDQHCIGLSEQDQPHNSLKRGSSDTLHSPAVKRGSSCFTQGSAKSSFSRSLPRKNVKDTKGQGFSLKASHELREAGQSHKFKDEIEYIMDGLRTKDSLRIRRTSCLELTRSMLKDDFTDQVRAHQYMPAIVEATHTDHDPIVLSCLALMIGVTLQNTNAYKDTVAINDLIPFLCASLQVDLDPMAMMPAGRQEIALFNDFKDLARQSGILRKGQKVLTKSILLSSIASVIQESVSSNDTQTLSLIEQDQQFLSTILQTLVEDLAWIKEPSSTPDVSLPDVLDIGRIEHCLCILERLAMVSGRPAAALASNTRLFPLLVQLVALCRAHAFQYPRETDSMNMMLHVLRLLINVTNGDEPCCESMTKSGSIPVLVQNVLQFHGHCRSYSPDEPQSDRTLQGKQDMIRWTRKVSNSDSYSSPLDTHDVTKIQSETDHGSGEEHLEDGVIENDTNGWYDILLLSLGLLINMLETNSQRRKLLTDSAIGLDCKGIGDCFHKECLCAKSSEALERLVGIYNTEVAVSEMTENQVLAAYLALLLGCVVEGNVDNETRLYRTVHGHSVSSMLEVLHGFVALHQIIQSERPDQQHQDKQMDSAAPFASSNNESLARSDSFMTLTLESDHREQEVVEGIPSSDMDNPSTGIVFRASTINAADTQQSFIKIIQVLQDIETRHSARSSTI